MIITKLEYEEFKDDEKYWRLANCEFGEINLIVGKNSTGKSRTISVIRGLCKILSGEVTKALLSGTYKIEIQSKSDKYSYYLELHKNKVTKENLFINDVEKLNRNIDGTGFVYYSEKGEYIKFKLPEDIIAITQQRDELQHPYLSELTQWAAKTIVCFFGTSMDRDHLLAEQAININKGKGNTENFIEEHIINKYVKGFSEFKEDFDKEIIKDMKRLGYNLVDVGCGDINLNIPGIKGYILGLFTVEKDLGFKNFQNNMSQGMFRALGLTILINYSAFKKAKSLILVDDIGEGLDFERSKSTIKLLMAKVKKHGGQLIMTSNDEFSMNSVPIEHWTILSRKGRVVKSYNIKNSKDKFKEFEFMGLNNFDFFASEIFK